MTFSSGFLTLLVYGSLVWCAISALGLAAMLIKDLLRGESW
ncbi:hypothetical protein [Alteraurantiacibacter aquimixticola]|nr:hypothetical protein [Alteraurantiacibacter aquimixticola]